MSKNIVTVLGVLQISKGLRIIGKPRNILQDWIGRKLWAHLWNLNKIVVFDSVRKILCEVDIDYTAWYKAYCTNPVQSWYVWRLNAALYDMRYSCCTNSCRVPYVGTGLSPKLMLKTLVLHVSLEEEGRVFGH